MVSGAIIVNGTHNSYNWFKQISHYNHFAVARSTFRSTQKNDRIV